MTMESEFSENVLTVRLGGDIDHHSAKGIREQIDDTAERSHPSELRLDFQNVSFMDSSGVGLIMGRYRLMGSMGGKLRIQNIPPQIEKMMRLAGLDRLPIWEVEEKKGDITYESHK